MVNPRLSFRLPSSERQRVFLAAEKLNATTSSLCRAAIRKFLYDLEDNQLGSLESFEEAKQNA